MLALLIVAAVLMVAVYGAPKYNHTAEKARQHTGKPAYGFQVLQTSSRTCPGQDQSWVDATPSISYTALQQVAKHRQDYAAYSAAVYGGSQ